mmetsp:Transcript_10556/g.35812  ORF Transcript_10556/g.35812 Transcript_10556/m.35812 type:complete len:719 (+) Transcript_10556:590-2746(+)
MPVGGNSRAVGARLGLVGDLQRGMAPPGRARAGGAPRAAGGSLGQQFPERLHADAVGEVTKGLGRRGALLLPRLEQRLHGGLEVVHLHLVHEDLAHTGAHGAARHPDLVLVGPLPDEGELGEVGARAPVGAARHARDEGLLVAEAHAPEGLPQARVEVRHDALRLRLGQAAERERRAGHGLARQHVHLVDGGHAVVREDLVDGVLLALLHVLQDHGLPGGEPHGHVELVDNLAEGRLELEAPLVNDAPLLHVEAQEVAPVALGVPAHPVDALDPRGQGHGCLEGPAKVGGHEVAERVHAESVHEVLHARVGAHLSVAVVPLHGEDGLGEVQGPLRGHEAELVRHARKRGLLVVRAAHATAHVHVEALERAAVGLHDHHEAQVVGVEVQRVVPGHGDGDLELAREVGGPVERLVLVARHRVDARLRDREAVHVLGGLHRLGQVVEVLAPVLRGQRLLAIEPELREGVALGLEQLGEGGGVPLAVHVGHVVGQHGGGRHHIAVDVATAAERGAARVGDGRDDRLEVLLEHAVELEGLARGGPQVALPVLVRHVVQLLVELRRHNPVGHLEAEHELVRLCAVRAAGLAVLLLVGAVVLEHHHGVLADGDLLVGHLVLEGLEQLAVGGRAGVDLDVLDAVQLLQVVVGLGSRVARLLRAELLPGPHVLDGGVWLGGHHRRGARTAHRAQRGARMGGGRAPCVSGGEARRRQHEREDDGTETG